MSYSPWTLVLRLRISGFVVLLFKIVFYLSVHSSGPNKFYSPCFIMLVLFQRSSFPHKRAFV